MSDGCISWSRKGVGSGVWRPLAKQAWAQGAGREVYGSLYCRRSDFPVLDSSSILSDMAADVLSKITETGRSNVHAISFLREMSATVGMLKNPFKVVKWVQKWASSRSKKRSLKDSFRSAHFRSTRAKNRHLTVKEVSNIAADTFLESMYGWNPFVHDMLAIADLAGSALKKREQLRAEGDQKFRVMRTGSRVEPIGAAKDAQNYESKVAGGKTGCTWKYVYYGTLNVSPSAKAEGALASIARTLNIDRLGYAMWDAVPYSFVVDWFLPVGDILDRQLSGPAFYIMADTPWVSARADEFFSVSIIGNPDYTSYYNVKYSGGASYGERVRTFSRYPCDVDTLLSRGLEQGMHGMRTYAGLSLGWGLLQRWHR